MVLNKKKIVLILIFIIIGIIGIGDHYFTKPQVRHLRNLRIGYQPLTHHLAHFTAMEKGWWKENLAKLGIKKVRDYRFPSGPAEMHAMLAGDIDIAYVGASPAVTAIAEGLDAKIVANVHSQGSTLILRPEIPYKNPKDLRGLKIATYPPGSIPDTVLKKWLKNHNIDFDEIEIKGMGPGNAIASIGAKAIDGVFLPEPGPTIIELEGNGKRVESSEEMWPKHSCCCLLISGKLIREHPKIVEEIVRIHLKATEYNKTHLDEAAEICAKKLGFNPEIIKESLKRWDGHYLTNPHLQVPFVMKFIKTLYGWGYIDKLLTKEDLFNTSFYEKVVRKEQ